MVKNNRPKQLRDFPQVLVDLAMKYEEDGTILCLLPAEDFAGMLRVEFTLPTPLEPKDATCFVKKLVNINVYYQRRLEAGLNVRGFWLAFGDKAYIFIEADRPYPSQIKTLIHEVSEKLRAISFLSHPEVAQPKDTMAANQQREAWANRVAAAVKMPPELFKGQFAHFLLDVEELKRVNDETLAAVARRLRDLVMGGHVFYWCRFDLAPYGLLKCPKLAELAEILGGTCVRIADVTYSNEVKHNRRRNKTLPAYNLPAYYHYRILSPMMNKYIEANAPVFIDCLEGGASAEYSYRDLYGENQLCVLLVPYGKAKTRGFFMLAVHPREKHLFGPVLCRRQPEERGVLEWLFTWFFYVHKKPKEPIDQSEIPGLGDEPAELDGLFAQKFGFEPYLWADNNPSPDELHDDASLNTGDTDIT